MKKKTLSRSKSAQVAALPQTADINAEQRVILEPYREAIDDLASDILLRNLTEGTPGVNQARAKPAHKEFRSIDEWTGHYLPAFASAQREARELVLAQITGTPQFAAF
jgi:hypothetical protein